MSLILYYHPLSSFCWKVLIPLYENGTAFTPRFVDPNDRSELTALWPMTKLPVLRDEAKRRTVPESTTIIEYLDGERRVHHHHVRVEGDGHLGAPLASPTARSPTPAG